MEIINQIFVYVGASIKTWKNAHIQDSFKVQKEDKHRHVRYRCQRLYLFYLALSRENLSSMFPTRSFLNQPAQQQIR